ncbi:MAG TPA: SDR family oxidoreductase [Intrasporangium sp.]|uniref:SDR family oxidoreductase n=1 Tax=Intrasporangium sp. TaxID=1925024 RepID=UPI002B46FEBA|nr:SDR family oxidoreductase [Intrasporangium sp.]HKX68962.1 SDR family oxidoreductase [Intrasporangium sp.]
MSAGSGGPSHEAGVAVVTGAGSGLGRVITRRLLEHGYRVALLGRRADALAETAAEAAAGAALQLPTDVTDEAAVARAFEAVVEAFGRIDLLVNNAGTFGPAGEADEIAVHAWREVIDVNLTGTFLCCREAFRIMRDQIPQGGRIINNGSISAQVPRPGQIAYAASKHAVTGLTRSLALDGRRHHIVCGQIDIGNATTDMTAGIARGARQADGSVRPEPTFDPSHVADVVLAMAQLPLDVSVPALTILATDMPYLGRG